MSSKSSKKTVEEYLVDEIKKTGYPLEIEVTSVMDKAKNWLSFNQEYYFDNDKNEGRSIDISASYIGEPVSKNLPEVEPFNLRTEMAIECKKSSTHAWVFFTIPETFRPPIFDGQTLDFLEVITHYKRNILYEVMPILRDMETERFFHYDGFRRIAVGYDEIRLSKGQDKGRKDIFEAVNQIMKYISYNFERTIQFIKKDYSFKLLYFIFPVIVFDGVMYECIMKKDIPRLVSRDHILLITHYRPKYSHNALRFGIDIVQRKYFPKFVKYVENDSLMLYNKISKKRRKLKELTEEAIEDFT